MADDLTGALDSAAVFSSPVTPTSVGWRSEAAGRAGGLAFDTGTREVDAETAARTIRQLAGSFFSEPGMLAFKKVDSLLRGSEAAEIDAILAARPFRHCLVAPAFPAQDRVTRSGRQGLRSRDGTFVPLASDLAARLEGFGRRVRRADPGAPLEKGVTLFDAECDGDLDRIASTAPNDALWVGSAGLAGALARRWAPPTEALKLAYPRPLLGLFGTDHEVMARQLHAVKARRLELTSHDESSEVARRLAEDGAVFVTVALPVGIGRAAAAERISERFGSLARRLDAPGTLVVAGGETLRSLCEVLGVRELAVCGEVSPGIPYSRLVGGSWDGTHTISKSGAFGAPDFLQTLLARLFAPTVGAAAP